MSIPDNFNFSELEVSFILLSLDEYEAFINDYARNSPTANQIVVNQNLDYLRSARKKLMGHEADFIANELQMLYSAVDNRRDTINAALDEGFPCDNDREDALALLRLANTILRRFKAIFAASGID